MSTEGMERQVNYYLVFQQSPLPPWMTVMGSPMFIGPPAANRRPHYVNGKKSLHYWSLLPLEFSKSVQQDGKRGNFIGVIGRKEDQPLYDLVFFNGPFPASFLFFSSFQQLTINMFIIKFCWWLDLNCGPLVSEMTAEPTKPQPNG